MNDLDRSRIAIRTTIEDVPDHLADDPHHLTPHIDEDHLPGNGNAHAPLHPFVTPHLPNGGVLVVVLLREGAAMSLPIKKD